MNKIFNEFEDWYKSQLGAWSNKGVYVRNFGVGKYGNNIRIELYSDLGEGNIVLYESNGLYWVDFEGANFDSGVIFLKANNDIEAYNQLTSEFIEYLLGSDDYGEDWFLDVLGIST